MSAKMIIVFSGNEDNALRIAELFYRSIYYLSGIIYKTVGCFSWARKPDKTLTEAASTIRARALFISSQMRGRSEAGDVSVKSASAKSSEIMTCDIRAYD